MAHFDASRASSASYDTGLGRDDLYTELWKSCAGPWVEVPSRNERVYYFPQVTWNRPERVSAWDIEPFTAFNPLDIPEAMKFKRARPVDIPQSDTSTQYAATSYWYAGANTTSEQSSLGGTTEFEYSERQDVWPPKKEDQHGTFINHSSRDITDGDRKVGSVNLFHESAEYKKCIKTLPVMPEYDSPLVSRASNDLVHDQVEHVMRTETSASYWLFGIDLRNYNNIPSPVKEVKDTYIAADSGLQDSSITLLELHGDENSDLHKENKQASLEAIKTESRHGSNASRRTRTKVQMQGIAVGRAVDLTLVEGYNDLITELEKMFEIKGEFKERKTWQVVYTDEEGDMMLVGDDPWLEFRRMAKKIFIYKAEEVKKMSRNCTLPGSCLDGEKGLKCLLGSYG